MKSFLDILICPVCGEGLERSGGSLRCPRGHSYDLSRAGYVNLLPPGKGRNAKSGDEKAMIRARAAFLRKGYYDPMDAGIASMLAERMPDTPSGALTVIDMGAGEGTHTCRIARLLGEITGRRTAALGFDASKHGAESGCAYARSLGLLPPDALGRPEENGPEENFSDGAAVLCLPGNLFRLPVRDGAADAALSLFAPIAWEETARILSPGGLFLAASSGREHLIELRRMLYDEVRYTDFHPTPPAGSGFALAERRTLSFTVEAESAEDVRNLFMMTPFCRRVPEERCREAQEAGSLRVTAEIELSLFRLTAVETETEAVPGAAEADGKTGVL